MMAGDETKGTARSQILWDWRIDIRTTEFFLMELLNLLTVLKESSELCCQKIILGDQKKTRTGKRTKVLCWSSSKVIMVDMLIVRFRIHSESITEQICCWFGCEMLDKEQI